jgi:SPP1 gp7 family putative phage head morphogenesis protein
VAIEFRPLPPEEAVRYFEAKGFKLHPSFDWRDVAAQTHATSFTVAKSAGFDILKDIHSAMLKVQSEGRTFEQFRKELTPILQEKGWWGRKVVTDPETGRKTTAQLGSPRRLRIIYDTNLRMNHAAGEWARIQRTKQFARFIRYVAIRDGRTRPQHRAWHGTVLPVDHGFWRTHFPPNGWRCRCTVQHLSEMDLEDFGYEASADPDVEMVPWTNDRTGEVLQVPTGVDPGFGHNPGQVALDQHAARALMGKLVDAPAELAAAQAASARFVVPALAADTRAWITDVLDKVESGKPPNTGERRVIGVLDADVLSFLEARGVPPQTGAITINDKEIAHIFRHRNDPIGLQRPVLENMVRALWDAQDVFWEKNTSALHYVLDIGQGSARLVVQVDYPAPPQKSVGMPAMMTSRVNTGRLIDPKVFENRGMYERIK